MAGEAWHGWASSGGARRGMARQARRGLDVVDRRGEARRVRTRHGRRGASRLGKARRVPASHGRHGSFRRVGLGYGWIWHGRLGKAGRGPVWIFAAGRVMAGEAGTGGHWHGGAVARLVLSRQAGRGCTWLVTAWHGGASRGLVWQARFGLAWLVPAGWGMVFISEFMEVLQWQTLSRLAGS
jgi:hypothetical protein